MPIYAYECEKCGHRFEVTHGVDDNGSRKCPKCKGAARKVFTPVSILFKGNGFYCTDAKKKTVGACKSAGGNGDKSPCSSCPDISEN